MNSAPPDADADGDFFALFALPRSFELDDGELSRRYRALQAAAHPDRFAGKSEPEKQAALAAAGRINEGYRTLKDPLARAAYMLSLAGINALAESGAQMSPAFLTQQMEWRETLEANGNDNDNDSKKLTREVREAEAATAAEAAALLPAEGRGESEKQKLADTLRRWQYIRKMLAAIKESE